MRSSRPAHWLAIGALFALFSLPMIGCEQSNRSDLDEALEEIEDEAKDARKEIEDEIDDHTR